jgi:LmbE family N-acetylglucosaminyl deacetylase
MTNGSAGRRSAPVLFIFAHPDDEAFGCAGVMAALVDSGTPVVLVTATRGEAGEISSDRLATPVSIGAVREMELRAAMALIGVDDLRFLGYRDSGMEGTPENQDARCLHQAPFEEVVAQLTAQIRAIRPCAVITFGADGIYGHPDHIFIHHATVAAVRAAADEHQPEGLGAPWRVSALYFTAIPRERIQAMVQRTDGPFRHMSPEKLAKLGTPEEDITTIVDVAGYRSLKERVIRAHQTQVGEGGPMANLPREQVEPFLSREHFMRVSLPWEIPPGEAADPLAQVAGSSMVSA